MVLVIKNLPASAEDLRGVGSIPGSGRSPGGGHGNPFQYSCLEKTMDRGAWPAPVHRVAKSWKWLKRLSMHACTVAKPTHFRLEFAWSLSISLLAAYHANPFIQDISSKQHMVGLKLNQFKWDDLHRIWKVFNFYLSHLFYVPSLTLS